MLFRFRVRIPLGVCTEQKDGQDRNHPHCGLLDGRIIITGWTVVQALR